MPIETTYTGARADLDRFLDAAAAGEVVFIRGEDGRDAALIDAAELSSLLETVYLFSSPRNGLRLLTALERAHGGTEQPDAVEALRAQLAALEDDSGGSDAATG